MTSAFMTRGLGYMLLVVSSTCGGAMAQEGKLASDFRREGSQIASSCSGFAFGQIASCGEVLFTGHPFHIAVGSLAPQNGFGSGAALVGGWNTLHWRNTWDVDAVAAPSGAWRAGGYLNFVMSDGGAVKVGHGRPTKGGSASPDPYAEQPVIHLYAEADSLNKVTFFGIGPGTAEASRSWFGMRETISGASAVIPVWRKLHLAVTAEANGRFVDTSGNHGQTAPSIEQVFPPGSVPGLFDSEAFAQFGQGVRLRPAFGSGHVQLDYAVNYKQFIATGNSAHSFRRFTTDLGHQFPLYRGMRAASVVDTVGPDQCAGPGGDCPPVVHVAGNRTRNLEGSIGLRFLLSESIVPAGHAEPFYLQPTLGGSDVNGNPALPSYDDYRYRAPNLMLLRGSFEHALPKVPLGVMFLYDVGKVGLQRSDMDFTHLQHSYGAGLTVRAGGLPVMTLLFAWGGGEGSHTIASLSNTLLGGGFRPSLF